MIEIRPVTNATEWAHARAIRQAVFIEEQHCPPEEEWDSFDEKSRHLLGYLDDVPVATARWRTVAHAERLAAKLERFAVLKPYRGQGVGRRLVEAALADARQAGFASFVLHAQAHLEGFYRSLGFKRVGAVFHEAGIPHVKMVRAEETDAAGPR